MTRQKSKAEIIDDKYTLICGDCLEALKQMDECSVDVTFTSPPYNDSAKTERDMETKRHSKYEYVEKRDDWYEWQCEVIDELLRVSRRQVLYNIQPILNNKRDVFRLMGHYADRIDQVLTWYKPNAQPQHYPHRIANFYEWVWVFRCKDFDKLYVNSNGYTNVIVQNINSNRDYCDKHRALMSTPFADEMIREFTMRGETVLDPFMGLATTGISCVKQGRKFVGMEIHEPYFKIALDRMTREASQISLFETLETETETQQSFFD